MFKRKIKKCLLGAIGRKCRTRTAIPVPKTGVLPTTPHSRIGAPHRTRTDTISLSRDFKSLVSANSTTGAKVSRTSTADNILNRLLHVLVTLVCRDIILPTIAVSTNTSVPYLRAASCSCHHYICNWQVRRNHRLTQSYILYEHLS